MVETVTLTLVVPVASFSNSPNLCSEFGVKASQSNYMVKITDEYAEWNHWGSKIIDNFSLFAKPGWGRGPQAGLTLINLKVISETSPRWLNGDTVLNYIINYGLFEPQIFAFWLTTNFPCCTQADNVKLTFLFLFARGPMILLWHPMENPTWVYLSLFRTLSTKYITFGNAF